MDCKRRLVSVLLAGIVLQGCAGQTTKPVVQPPGESANEALLQAAGNHSGLITLYRDRLTQSKGSVEQRRNRQKLAQTYLAVGDTESALFYCEPVIRERRDHGDCLLITARALLSTGAGQKALDNALAALTLRPNDPVILNQIGLIHADAGRYSGARAHFNQARLLMLDDVTARNNLAMVDILEQKWQQAADRLLPLFHSGQADDKVRANLLLALARSERPQEFMVVCGRTRQTCQRYYSTLSQTTLFETGRAT